ncbi:hypothetical protein SAMN05660461_5018 [Chitinophaga ginsengisegetis]|uniref:Uncharacterized protein n=2 Tax=Chitinophaga ginsengisegetis TaxID=393003 RepID=A0A1T5P942_9BACT|nr:hypothetical protein SAMN05660461_5018 [Chitinophaga ginsengisegetis]
MNDLFMERQWNQTGEGKFVFLMNGEEIGTYQRGDDWKKEPTTFNILQNEYNIEYSSGLFSRGNIKILNESGEPVLKLKSIPFSLNFNFEYQNRQFKLVFKDAPLWQWSIMEKDNLVLSYKTDLSKGTTGLSIQSREDADSDYLFDFLLGHLILGKEKKDVME